MLCCNSFLSGIFHDRSHNGEWSIFGKDGFMSTEPWVSVEDIAQHLSVAKDSIYRWIEQKGLPAHKLGRIWKFKISEVDEWVRAGCNVAGNDNASEEGKR